MTTDETVNQRAQELNQAGQKTSARSLWNDLGRYRKYGLIGLARKTRSDANVPRNISPEMVEVIQSLRLSGKYGSTEMAWERACEIARHRGEAEPSQYQVTSICRQLWQASKLLADGRKDIYNKIMRPTGPITIPEDACVIQIDTTLIDLLSIDERPGAKKPAIRLKLIIAYDKNSGRVVARKLLHDDPNRFDVGSVIYEVLRTFGQVNEFQVDRGKIYTANHVKLAMKQIGILYEILPPYSPTLKAGVERFFRTLNLGLWRYQPGYTASNTKERPEVIQVKLTADEVLEKLDAFITRYNNKRKRKTRLSPIEYWEKYYLMMPVDPTDLHLLLELRKSNKVQRDGIPFNGHCYWNEDLFPHIGQKLEIRSDPYDEHPNEIEIYHRGKWLCTAEKQAPTRRQIQTAQRRQLITAEAEVDRAKEKLQEIERELTGQPEIVPAEKQRSRKSKQKNSAPDTSTQPAKSPTKSTSNVWNDMPDVQGRGEIDE